MTDVGETFTEFQESKEILTSFELQAAILAELWMNYRNDEEFQDFIEYSDLGLPLAYAIDAGIVVATPEAQNFIYESFALLLEGLDLEDTGFETLDDLLGTEESQE